MSPPRIATLLIAFGMIATHAVAQRVPLTEASGIAVVNGNLLIVGDDAPGRYYRFHHPSGIHDKLIVLYDSLLEEIQLPGATLASDLESIEQLIDGRIVLLSEDLSSLIGPVGVESDSSGVIVLYPQFLSEFGNRGLEGLAVEQSADGNSRIAVLWEGGYPESRALSAQMRDTFPMIPLFPLILVHPLATGESGILTRPDARQLITVHPTEPPGAPPDAERFRAPDLVWHEWKDSLGHTIEGFVLLLGSGNAPLTGTPTYTHHWLQRFTMYGQPFGAPFDLDAPFLAALREEAIQNGGDTHIKSIYLAFSAAGRVSVNWEGMDWYEPGESLILVYDTYPAEPPIAFRIAIPLDWRLSH